MSIEFFRAVKKGDIARMDAIINGGLDPKEITSAEKWSYLHKALLSVASPPAREGVQHLISLGLDVNAVDAFGNTPLIYACSLRRPDLIDILVTAGADVNFINKVGMTPLRQLFFHKPYIKESFRLLIDAGADVNQKRDGEMTAKEFAFNLYGLDDDTLKLFEN